VAQGTDPQALPRPTPAIRFAVVGHRDFNAQYDKALAAWTSGKRTVRFPQGTWWMRVCHCTRCGPAP
jgi:hypothetical protein